MPFCYAKIIWSEDGNNSSFIQEQNPTFAGMGSINIIPLGLFSVKSNGTYKQLIDTGLYVKFIARKPDGIHFKVAKLEDSIEVILSNVNEIIYNPAKGELKYTEYIPEGYKAVIFQNMKNYNLIKAQLKCEQDIFISGNYVLTYYNNGYARYDLKSHKKILISPPIGIYSGYFYYYDNPENGGIIKKMNIAKVSGTKKLTVYAQSFSAYISGNKLYYLNPQLDSEKNSYSVPYYENLDTYKLTRLSSLPYENSVYYIFELPNGNKVSPNYIDHTFSQGFRLEDKDGKFIRTVGEEYYNGFFYTIEKTDDGKYSVIDKIDINGKKVQTLYRVSNQYASIISVKISGGKLYFVAGGNLNLYSCNLDGTNLIKY